MKNVIGLAILALVLAFVAVQGASLVQNPPASTMLKGQSVAETDVHYQATRPPSPSLGESFPTIVLAPLVIAALCYLLVRKRA